MKTKWERHAGKIRAVSVLLGPSGSCVTKSLSLPIGHKKHKWVSLNCFFYLWHNWNLMLVTFKSDILSALCSSLRMGGIPSNVL